MGENFDDIFLNCIPIICPVCDGPMQYKFHELDPRDDFENYPAFHSWHCPQNVIDEFSRDSHALFNFSNEGLAHCQVIIDNCYLTISYYPDDQIYYSRVVNHENHVIWSQPSPIKVNWLSKESINLTIKSLLVFQ